MNAAAPLWKSFFIRTLSDISSSKISDGLFLPERLQEKGSAGDSQDLFSLSPGRLVNSP